MNNRILQETFHSKTAFFKKNDLFTFFKKNDLFT